jgi:hypothetical protein
MNEIGGPYWMIDSTVQIPPPVHLEKIMPGELFQSILRAEKNFLILNRWR